MPKKKSILDFHKMKEDGEKVTWMTAYDYPQASFLEAAGIDMILVGDSLGMIVLGYNGTIPRHHGRLHPPHAGCTSRRTEHVRRRRHAFGSYQISAEEAVRNAVRFLKEADVDAVKLEGGQRVGPADLGHP